MDFAIIAWSSLLACFSLITAVHGNSIRYCSELYNKHCAREPKDILKIEVNCTNNSNVFVKWSLKNDNSDIINRIILEYSCSNRSGEQLPDYPKSLGGVYLSTIYNGHTSISNLPISKDVECIFGGCVEIYGAYNCWHPNFEEATCNYTESTSSHISPTCTTLETFSTDVNISIVVNSTSVKSALILMSSPLVSSVNSSYILSSFSISLNTKFESPTVITSSSLISMTTEFIATSDPNVTFTLMLAIMSGGLALIISLCGLILMACLINYCRWKQKYTHISVRNHLNQFSIFGGCNPLDLANPPLSQHEIEGSYALFSTSQDIDSDPLSKQPQKKNLLNC